MIPVAREGTKRECEVWRLSEPVWHLSVNVVPIRALYHHEITWSWLKISSSRSW